MTSTYKLYLQLCKFCKKIYIFLYLNHINLFDLKCNVLKRNPKVLSNG